MKLKRMVSLGLSLVMALSALNTVFAGDDTGAILDMVQLDTGADEATSTGAVTAYATGDYSYPVEGGNIYYDSNGVITDCDTTVTSAVIPAEIGGVKITEIGADAFRGCSSLTSISIPKSVTSIEHHAFWCCISLTNISIPDSVTTIGLCQASTQHFFETS